MSVPSPKARLRIFLSYAAEQLSLSEQIYQRLKNLGHQVFFDRTSLRPGKEYDTAILEELRSSDLMVFLISPRSIEEGSYARTELRYAQDIWRNPEGRVLPVMAVKTDLSLVPAYLTAITIFRPEGNIPAEVVAKVNDLASGWKPGDTLTDQLWRVQKLAELNQRLAELDQYWDGTQRQYRVNTGGASLELSPVLAAVIPLLFGVICGVFAFVDDGFFLEFNVFGMLLSAIGAVVLFIRASEYEAAKASYLDERGQLLETISKVRLGTIGRGTLTDGAGGNSSLFRHV